jgi:hypothetical protein
MNYEDFKNLLIAQIGVLVGTAMVVEYYYLPTNYIMNTIMYGGGFVALAGFGYAMIRPFFNGA